MDWGYGIREKTYPGSRDQKSTGSWIRNTDLNYESVEQTIRRLV
jgi:hypothetical protein